MNYLVTGGTGLIGSRIIRDIIKEGGQAVAYDLFPEANPLEQLLSEEERERVKIVQGDVTDLPLLIRIVKENNIETMFHLAALLGEAAEANPSLAVKINVEGTINIFETARILGLKKVVWASSNTVFGPPEKYAEEYVPNDAPHYPRGVYGASKSFGERVATRYFEQYGVDITAVRYCLVYGARQERGGSGALIRELMLNPALGKPGKAPSGDDTIGFVYVDDVARATVMASKVARTKTGAYSIMGDVRSIQEAADYVKKLLPDADITLSPGNRGLSWKLDTAPIEKEVGYHRQWSMEQGIKEVINATRQQYGLPPV